MEYLWPLYLGAIPIVTIWAMLSGWRSDRPELMRCGAVVLVHAAIMQLATLFWPVVEGQGYPFLFIAGTLTIIAGEIGIGQSGVATGKLSLYGTTSGRVTIPPNDEAGNEIVLTAPATTGTIALTSDLSPYALTSTVANLNAIALLTAIHS